MSVTTFPASSVGLGAVTPWDNSTGAVTVRTMTSSVTQDITNSSRDYVIGEEVRERIIAISMIMACTLVGNLTLILILLCKRSRRVKRVNIFLINLAFGDLAVAIFVNSTEILFLAFGDWVLGAVMCKVMVYVQVVCLASATNLLTAMTLDRYQVIVKPMETLARRPRILLKIAIAWVLSLIFPLPQLFIFVQYEGGTKYDGTPKRICGSRGYKAAWQRKVNFTFTTTYILVVPVLVMLYCYARIIHVVWVRASKDVLQHSAATQQLHQSHHHHHHQHQHQHNHQHHQQQHHQHNHKQQKQHLQKRKNGTGGTTGTTANISGKKIGSALKRNRAHQNDNLPSLKKHVDDGLNSSNYDKSSLKPVDSTTDTSVLTMNTGPQQNNVKWAEDTGKTSSPSSNKDASSADVNGGKKNSTTVPSVQVSVRRKMMTSSKRRVLTMTLSVVMSFFICHTPYFVLTLIRIYSDYRIKMETGQLIGEFMVMVHSTLNPLLYGLFTLRQKHLKYLASLVNCFGGRSSRRGSVDADEHKGEMHCLLRRPFSKAPTNHKSSKDGSGHGTDNSRSGPGKTLANNRTGSPSSLSTSASSSTTSLKSSILSRFRSKNSKKPSKPVSSSHLGEREESSVGDSLLYSNSDALDLCTTTAAAGDDGYKSSSPKLSISTTISDTIAPINSGTALHTNRNKTPQSSPLSCVTRGLNSKKKKHVDKDSPRNRRRHHHHHHHHRNSNRDRKPGDCVESGIVLTNPSVTLELEEMDKNDPEKKSVLSSPIENVPNENGDMKEVDHPEERKEEEEEEVIPPVDFNSVPWEDEFIIGGLSRV